MADARTNGSASLAPVRRLFSSKSLYLGVMSPAPKKKTIRNFLGRVRSNGLFPLPELGFGLRHRSLYYADTMGKGSESESVETCSA